MNRTRTISLSVLLAGMVLISACAPKATATPAPTEIAKVEVEPTATDLPTEVPEPTAIEAVLPSPTIEPTEELVEENEAAACIDCHADKDLLIETARIEEEVESENEGEG